MNNNILSLKSNNYFICDENTITIEKRKSQESFVIHDHDFNELVMVFSGNGIHTWNGDDYPITCGDFFYINANDRHGYYAVNQLRLVNILYKPEKLLFNQEISKYLPLITEVKEMRQWKLPPSCLSQFVPIIEQIDKECRKPDSLSIHLCESLFLQFILLIYRYRYQPNNSPVSSVHLIDILITRLNQSISTPFSLNGFAQEHQVASRSLYRLFKSNTGMTITGYLQQLRLCHAATLLRTTDLLISDIAAQCGYEDSNYFSSVFHKKMNITASDYRQNFHNNK
ncbi:TPA: helix-turn-helix domain-containing protein [Proteus mirabilis]